MTSMSTYRPMREVYKDDVDKRGTAATHTRLPMSGRSRILWPMRDLRGEHVIESNQWEEESGVTSHVSFPAPSCHDQYCPRKKGVGPVTVEPPPITYTSGTVFPKEQLGSRNTVPDFLLKKMKVFQTQNNIPIHLKGGPVDKLLFGSTLVLCAVGLGSCFQFFYQMAFPPKND